MLPLRRRLYYDGLIVRRLVGPPAHRIRFHLLGWVGLQEIEKGFLLLEAGVEPRPVVLGMEDHRHAVVDLAHQVVGIRGDDGAEADLLALLEHYGGEEEQETPPPPAKPSPPPAPVHVEGRGELQNAINGAPPGTTVTLGRGEFGGPIAVDKPLVLEGKGAVIWAREGPVVTVSAGGVVLRNVSVEVTVPGGRARPTWRSSSRMGCQG